MPSMGRGPPRREPGHPAQPPGTAMVLPGPAESRPPPQGLDRPGALAEHRPPGPALPRPDPATPPAPAVPVPAWARAGLDALAAADPDLARIEPAAGPLPWRVRPTGFPGLLRAICGQMISEHAASAIWRRLAALPGALHPEGLLRLDDAALCGAAGLSRFKAAHARALAGAALGGTLRLDALPGMTDAEALAALTAVRGLGRWTAQVHLVLAEQRPDVFPESDLALAAGLAHLRGLPVRPAPRDLALAAVAWAPWRSLAARLLWHWWRHATGRPGGEA